MATDLGLPSRLTASPTRWLWAPRGRPSLQDAAKTTSCPSVREILGLVRRQVLCTCSKRITEVRTRGAKWPSSPRRPATTWATSATSATAAARPRSRAMATAPAPPARYVPTRLELGRPLLAVIPGRRAGTARTRRTRSSILVLRSASPRIILLLAAHGVMETTAARAAATTAAPVGVAISRPRPSVRWMCSARL